MACFRTNFNFTFTLNVCTQISRNVKSTGRVEFPLHVACELLYRTYIKKKTNVKYKILIVMIARMKTKKSFSMTSYVN